MTTKTSTLTNSPFVNSETKQIKPFKPEFFKEALNIQNLLKIKLSCIRLRETHHINEKNISIRH